MTDSSLKKFGGLVGSNTAIGMAQRLGVNGPPPPISVRDLIRTFGLPQQPTDLRLFWDVNALGQINFHPPDEQGVPPQRNIQFDWREPTALPVARATSFQLQVKVATTGQALGPFSVPAPGVQGVVLEPDTRYAWTVVPLNDFGQGPGSPVFTLHTASATPPPPPPPPPPATGTLTLRVGMALFGQQRSLTTVAMAIVGPGVPAGTVPFQFSADRSTATASLALPPPPSGQGSVPYTIRATVAFHYDGLINPNTGSISGPEDTTVELAAPVTIPWTGQSHSAQFAINYNGFDNVFIMTFLGLF